MIVFVVLMVIVVAIEVNPTLSGSSQTAPIGAFNGKIYSTDTVAIGRGQSFSAAFDYQSYEPAILVIDVQCSDIQNAGVLSIICNGRYVGSIQVSPDKPTGALSAISVCGSEWVKPPSAYSTVAFTNQVIVSSDYDTGFEGTVKYQISLKGSQ